MANAVNTIVGPFQAYVSSTTALIGAGAGEAVADLKSTVAQLVASAQKLSG